jgi:hypothetical protein
MKTESLTSDLVCACCGYPLSYVDEACPKCLPNFYSGLNAGRVNAPMGTTSEPVVREPQGNAGESPAPLRSDHRTEHRRTNLQVMADRLDLDADRLVRRIQAAIWSYGEGKGELRNAMMHVDRARGSLRQLMHRADLELTS